MLSFADAKSFPGYDQMYGNPLRMLMAMVGLVLLIALTNVVMLLLARNAARQREFSRAAGAGRGTRRAAAATADGEFACWCSAGGALAWGFAEMATRLLGAVGADRIEPGAGQDCAAVHAGRAGDCGACCLGLAPLRVASGRRSGAGAEDFGGRVECRCGQIDAWAE